MTEDRQLRGLSERTQERYVRSVWPLAAHYHPSPDQITEEALRGYFLHLNHGKRSSRSASPIALWGSTFFYDHPRKREWSTLTFVRAPREQTLPAVLRVEEVRTILTHLTRLRSRVCLPTLSSCGLRLQEGTHLQVPAIASARMLIHVRCGQGAKDR